MPGAGLAIWEMRKSDEHGRGVLLPAGTNLKYTAPRRPAVGSAMSAASLVLAFGMIDNKMCRAIKRASRNIWLQREKVLEPF